MTNYALIADAHGAAHQELERLQILLLLAQHGRSVIPECQQAEVDTWVWGMAAKAQDLVKTAADALANLKEEAK